MNKHLFDTKIHTLKEANVLALILETAASYTPTLTTAEGGVKVSKHTKRHEQ